MTGGLNGAEKLLQKASGGDIPAMPDPGSCDTSSGEATRELTIWYDGGCPLCRREIALMRRLDRTGAIIFEDATDDGLTCPIDRAELLARLHAREEGIILSGAAAFAAMWRAIPLLRPLGLAARQPRVLAWLERCYRHFLRARAIVKRLVNRHGRA
jgi:predicted DCC family thiol-disulfide oxidoreductase YuxK